MGRADEMQSGATGGQPVAYTPTSVLDTLTKSPNGLGESDADRLLIGGGILPSTNGRSSSTAQKRRYLDSPTASI
jgi:hypothetical protein